MGVTLVFETHSTSEDNELGVASGWADGPLSAQGREQASALGDRRRDDRLSAVFSSDLLRATRTVDIAFADHPIPVFRDWRLRECDFGELTREPADAHQSNRRRYLERPYPGGESWRQAVTRVAGVLEDLTTRWDETRVLIVGHVATRWTLDHHLNGVPLETLATSDFNWQEGWEFQLPTPT